MCPDPDVTFYLYTRFNPEHPEQISVGLERNISNLMDTAFDPSKPSKIVIHGYNSNMHLSALEEIRKEYVKTRDFNVFAVDWSPLNRSPCYIGALINVRHVGTCTAQLVQRIRELGGTDIHVIGFSLGAHITNYMAIALRPYKLPRITGLDPAFPGFITPVLDDKLDKSDAEFVDVYHTNAFMQGKVEESGHVDFYINGGVIQPGCWAERRFFACNHHRAPLYYAESVNTEKGFFGWPCPSYLQYLLGRCPPKDPQIMIGEFISPHARGVYLVITESVSPYAVGKYDGPAIEILLKSDRDRSKILNKYKKEILEYIDEEYVIEQLYKKQEKDVRINSKLAEDVLLYDVTDFINIFIDCNNGRTAISIKYIATLINNGKCLEFRLPEITIRLGLLNIYDLIFLAYGTYNRSILMEKYPDLGNNFVIFPDEENGNQLGYLDPPAGPNRLFGIGNNVEEDVTFTLYTRQNPEGIELKNFTDFSRHIDTSKKTVFVTHGWMSSGKKDNCIIIKNGYLEASDVNVFIVDWSAIAGNIFYVFPMGRTKDVGDYYSRFLNYLVNDMNMDPKDFHLIGHSLGAHVSGFAARGLIKGKVGRITGLDPALPGFDAGLMKEGRLNTNDSDLVDVIHTCAGFLGLKQPIGHVDFYPNGGGPPQPGCSVTEACSHSRSWKLYAESITLKQPYMASRCESFELLFTGKCNGTNIPMGYSTPNGADGVYYIETTGEEPYINL
ncbi:uncharacterized protein LOC108905824 [Anoplophora glabripennis]|uniref:uncharacterized protein LOC108905824 n=1 Tax=Anoplophora glabripennis TaxID=217634 RepID=UPI0008748CA3|nr:uncharacterized protein LOC108905824 [Anoplophora glabripennis]